MRSIGQIKTLYNKIYFNKKNLILISICFIAIIVMAYSSLNLGFTESEFLFLKDDYINEYIKSCYSFSLIINSVIVPALFLAELKEETNIVNAILIPRVKKETLLISKITIMFEISFSICAIEIMIIGILPCIAYPNFNLEWNYLLIGLYMILYTVFSVLLLNVLMKFIKLFAIGVFPVIIYLLINIFKDDVGFIKHIICLNTEGLALVSYNCLYFFCGIIIILICLYIFC